MVLYRSQKHRVSILLSGLLGGVALAQLARFPNSLGIAAGVVIAMLPPLLAVCTGVAKTTTA